jgi:predicted nucleic acid-binding Zn ribbon protein
VSADEPPEPDPGDALDPQVDPNPQVDPDAQVDPDPHPQVDPDAVDESGPDAVRAALNRARAAAKSRGLRPGQTGTAAGAFARRRRLAGEARRSGAYPDARDPQLVSLGIEHLVAERGWQAPVAVGGVIGRWSAVVGPDVAAHCTPLSFEDGVLVVQAASTAWATQVRLLAPALLRRLAEEVGEGTVTKVVVRGPTAPSWRRGLRVAPGSQGPRDTYG